MASRKAPLLRTKAGCVTCRTRRKKCDLAKTTCNECSRLHLVCEWLANENTSLAQAVREGLVVQKNRSIPLGSIDVIEDHKSQPLAICDIKSDISLNKISEVTRGIFDHPAILRASPTSLLKTLEEKQLYQFLEETAHSCIRLPVAKVPALENLNVFTVALAIASQEPGLLDSHLAFAAAQLSKRNPAFAKFVPKFYSKAIGSIKSQFDAEDGSFPSESVCGVAGVLSVLELCMFTNEKIRVAHLLGFHHLMQLKLRTSPKKFGPVKILPELYSHLLATSSTFYPKELIENKPYEYFDGLMGFMNATPRPLGPEVLGVPPELLTATWRLSYLRSGFIAEPERTERVGQLILTLTSWQPEPRLLHPLNRDKWFITQLYHSACLIFAHKLENPNTENQAPVFQNIIERIVPVVEARSQAPLLNEGWPSIILCLATIRRKDLLLLQSSLHSLVDNCGLKAFTSAIKFTNYSWGNGPDSNTFRGLNALFDDEMLRRVHI